MKEDTQSRWETVPLGTLVQLRNGINYTKDNFGRGIKIISVKNFQDYLFPKYEDLDEINPEGIIREESLLRDGDIVFVRSNGNRELIGRSLFIRGLKEKVTHSAFTIKVHFNSDIVLPRFYAYLFRTSLIRQGLSAYGSGTNISNLNQEILSNLQVPLPPLSFQKRIVEILSAYDDLIENNTRRIRILEEMAQVLYSEWFVKFRFPGHEKVKMVESELGMVPEGWELTTLGRLIEFKKCKKPNATQPTPDGGAIPALLIDSLRGAAYEYAHPEKLVTVCFSDTIMVMDGSGSGEVFIGHEGAVGSTLGRYRASGACGVGPYWIYLYFVGNQADIRGKNVGAAIPHANKDYINSMAVAGPSD